MHTEICQPPTHPPPPKKKEEEEEKKRKKCKQVEVDHYKAANVAR
jgi:hypothetical protein